MLKISIISCSFYVIYSNLKQNPALHFKQTLTILFPNTFKTFIWLALICLFSLFNWGLEIFKWKTLVKTIKATSFTTAAKEVLGSHTASLFTPNRIGEYGAKALFYPSKQRVKILILNAVGNISQMLITTLTGSLGLVIFLSEFTLNLKIIPVTKSLFFLGLLTAGLFIYLLKYPKALIQIKTKLNTLFRSIPKSLFFKILGLSGLRYVVFSTQFYLLLYWFEIELGYSNYITIASCMYLLASIPPSLFIFDVVLKGSIAVYLFSFYNINASVILSCIFLIWIFNTVFPALPGAIFVLNYKLPEKH